MSACVYLVGAGPGDPGLLTARALELIAAADVILYDRLIPAAALDGARADAEVLFVGKEGGGPSVPQEQRVVAPTGEAMGVIHLAAAISLEEAIGQLLTEYALVYPKTRVRAIFGASNELADHVLAGAPCDLFVSADPLHLERLASARRIDAGATRVVATNSLAALGPQSLETTVRSTHDLLAPEIKQVVLADPACPLGKYTRGYLEQQGLYDKLLPKVVAVDNSRGVLAAIRAGRADAGLAFASDAARAMDCRVLFEIDPAEVGLAYTAAVCGVERQQEAQKLLDFFQSPAAERCFRRCGLTLPERERK